MVGQIELAKVILKNLFSYPEARNGIPYSVILLIAKEKGVYRGDLKEARIELGITSEDRDGTRYWHWPKE